MINLDVHLEISDHARKRIKERCGVRNRKAISRLVRKAFEEGLTHRDVTGKLCKYVDSLYLKYHRGNQIRLFGDKAYIFDNEILITVLPIPHNLLNLVEIAKRKKQDTTSSNF
mgnify:CR=1 FL=1